MRNVGESADYVCGEDAPSRQQILALGDTLKLPMGTGLLVAELAADAGPRWGELFQVTADDVITPNSELTKKGKPKKARLHIKIDWQIDSGAKAGENHRKPPKGNKRRKAAVGEVSITGYALHVALLARVAQARQERVDGANPEALLFPTEDGDLFFYTAFSNVYFRPAAIAANWPHQEWTHVGHRWNEAQGTPSLVTEKRLQFDITWHSLRHRYARTCVDIRRLTASELMAHGGWDSGTVVKNLLYNVGEEHLDSGTEKFC